MGAAKKKRERERKKSQNCISQTCSERVSHAVIGKVIFVLYNSYATQKDKATKIKKEEGGGGGG
jgi:hypothetical protein